MKVQIFCILLTLLIAPTAFAQTDSLIVVQTDDSTYNEGDAVIISGQVSIVLEGTPVTLKISNDGRLIEVGQPDVAQDGSYSHIIIAKGMMWTNEGEYVVEASYGDETAETTFNYFPKVDSPVTTNIFEVAAGSSGTFDVNYTIQGGVVTDMRIDEQNFALVVTIEAADEGTISLDLSRSAIDAKKLDQSDDVYIVYIDESEVPHTESKPGLDSRIITVNFEEGDSEIMIIGTWVIPEFGTMAMIIFGIMITVMVLLTKTKLQSTKF